MTKCKFLFYLQRIIKLLNLNMKHGFVSAWNRSSGMLVKTEPESVIPQRYLTTYSILFYNIFTLVPFCYSSNISKICSL